MKQITEQATRQDYWNGWLAQHLPEEISTKVTGVSEREGTLTVFAESSAWSARLRYALLEREAQLKQAQPGIAQLQVRVLPRRKIRTP